MPWFVATNMVPFLSANFFVATPAQYARSAMRAIGYGSETIPYWTHVLQIYLQQLFLDWVMNKMMYEIMMSRRKKGQGEGRGPVPSPTVGDPVG